MNETHLAAVVEAYEQALETAPTRSAASDIRRHAVRTQLSLAFADAQRRGLTTSEHLTETVNTVRSWVSRVRATATVDAGPVKHAAMRSDLGARPTDIEAAVAVTLGNETIEWSDTDTFETALVAVAVGVVSEFASTTRRSPIAALRALSPERDGGDPPNATDPLLQT